MLWAIYKDSFSARTVWSLAGICQSMLANAGSTSSTDQARRLRVRQRNIDYNTQLAAVCAAYVHCRYDGGTVFATAFTRSDVTTRDYFHPSVGGQTKLASATWGATFNFGDSTPPTSTGAIDAGLFSVTSSADDAGVKGVEYRLAGAWSRYVDPSRSRPARRSRGGPST